MIHRLAEERIRTAIENGKIAVIMGARQVGKSTLAKNIIPSERSLTFNGDSFDIRHIFSEIDETKLGHIIGDAKYILVDEAQKIDNIGNMLKLLSDCYGDVRAVVTGSSSFGLAAAVNESLTGRKREFRLYPLSFKEMVETNGSIEEIRMLDHRMIYGYYPEVVMHPNDEKDILKELIDSYLYKDVLSLDSVGKPEKIVKLLQALSFQIGSTVSSNELSRLIGLDVKTVEKYIDVLEKCFIIYRLPSYAANQRNELKFAKKIYFWDMGIRNAVIGNMASLEMRSPEEAGHIWENFILTERIKRNEYAGRTFVQHYFWRTQQQKEIDLLEMEDGVLSAFEFKWFAEKKAHVPSQFSTAYPDAAFSYISPANILEFLM